MVFVFTIKQLDNAKNAPEITKKFFDNAVEEALQNKPEKLKDILTIEYYVQVKKHLKQNDYYMLSKVLQTNCTDVLDMLLVFIDKKDTLFIEKVNEYFIGSIAYRRLEMVQHVLKSLPEVNFDKQKIVNVACEKSGFGIVKHILSNYPLNDTQQPFINACSNDNACIAKYLINYAQETKNVIKPKTYTEVIKQSCEKKSTKIISYLVNDYKLPYSNTIKKYLNSKDSNDFKNEVRNMFELRELNRNLHEQLIQKVQTRKPKI